MGLARRTKVSFDPEMDGCAARGEPTAASLRHGLRLGNAGEAEPPGVKGYGVRLSTRRHRQLDVVQTHDLVLHLASPLWCRAPTWHSTRWTASLPHDMGSLIKKRRKRMRKKKHKKMLKATRWQRRAGK
jgi:hypothetical protein